MGFFDKVKNALGSKKEDAELKNSADDELIDKSEPIESIETENLNEEIQSEDSEEIPTNEEIIDKHSPNDKIRNFKYLDDLIHSGIREIVLDSDIILNSDEESKYWKGIKLDLDDLAIDGNGHVIDACGKARIFYCTGKNVTIKNITLKNGFAEYSGGAIDNIEGELTIAGSLLTANTAGTDGGAIGNNEGKLMIAGCSLTGNSAQFDGGAIRNQKGELKITGSTLTENTANSDGGAVY